MHTGWCVRTTLIPLLLMNALLPWRRRFSVLTSSDPVMTSPEHVLTSSVAACDAQRRTSVVVQSQMNAGALVNTRHDNHNTYARLFVASDDACEMESGF